MAKNRHAMAQGMMTEVREILFDNVEQVTQRGERLDELIGRTDTLQAAACTFKRESRRAHNNYWWKENKLKLTIGIIVLTVFLFIILAATFRL